MTKLILTQGISSGYLWPVVDSSGTAQDITGWSAKCQVRSEEDVNSELYTELSCTVSAEGVAVSWTAEESLLWNFAKGYFDVVLVDQSGTPRQILTEGMFSVNKVVTRV